MPYLVVYCIVSNIERLKFELLVRGIFYRLQMPETTSDAAQICGAEEAISRKQDSSSIDAGREGPAGHRLKVPFASLARLQNRNAADKGNVGFRSFQKNFYIQSLENKYD